MFMKLPAQDAIDSIRFPDRFGSMNKEDALDCLRRISRMDLGEDVDAWERWASENNQLGSVQTEVRE